jgi:hypothetical protein
LTVTFFEISETDEKRKTPLKHKLCDNNPFRLITAAMTPVLNTRGHIAVLPDEEAFESADVP